MDKINTFIELADKAQVIMDSGADWETIYDLIFLDGISDAIIKTDIAFFWHDPDTTYEADVRAFVTAIQRKANQLRKVSQILEKSND